MNIIVTGGCGFVGTALCLFLKKKKFKVISVDNLSKVYSKKNEYILKKNKIRNFRFNIGKFRSLENLKFKSDIIVDCSADPAVENSRLNQQKVFESNLVSTFNILKKNILDNSSLIFLSTSRVYPISESYKKYSTLKRKKLTKVFNEKTNTNGIRTFYGYTKFASEMMIEEFSYSHNIKYIINRCGLISGIGQYGKVDQGLISLWLWRHINKIKLNYIGFSGSGKQLRDVLDIEDLCNLIFLQIKKLNKINNETFCVGGGKNNTTNLLNLSSVCSKITGNKLRIGKIKKTSNYDIPFFVTSNKKVMSKYNWKPKKKLKEIFTEMYSWMIKENKKIKRFF